MCFHAALRLFPRSFSRRLYGSHVWDAGLPSFSAASTVLPRSDIPPSTRVATLSWLGEARERSGNLEGAAKAYQSALLELEKAYGFGHVRERLWPDEAHLAKYTSGAVAARARASANTVVTKAKRAFDVAKASASLLLRVLR